MNFNIGISPTLLHPHRAAWVFGMLIIFYLGGTTRCYSQKIVKFDKIDPELYTTESLKKQVQELKIVNGKLIDEVEALKKARKEAEVIKPTEPTTTGPKPTTPPA